MSDRAAIQHALEQASITAAIAEVRPLSGGCIHTVCEVRLADGSSVVAKFNAKDALPMFQEESHSLRALASTNTVRVPQPLWTGSFGVRAVLLMTFIKPADQPPGEEHWRQFGGELAALHLAPAGGRYGFEVDNHIGCTPQPNTWHDDWIEFNAVNRLGFQLARARDNDVLEDAEVRLVDALIARLDEFIPRRPRPSLLHGDLWSGNAIAGVDDAGQTRIAVIDPASSVGDGWADIAMMKLFGGFSHACFDAYTRLIPPPDDLEVRLAVYQLYHVLNHVNLFGRGYAAQAMGLVRRVLKSA